METAISLIAAFTALLTAMGTSVGVVIRIAHLQREVAELKAVLRVHGIWYEIGDPGQPTRSYQASAKGASPKVEPPPAEPH